MTLPAALLEYLERSPDAAIVLSADGTELWRNARVTDAILEAIARLIGESLPPESAVTVGTLSIVIVAVDDVFVATAREVAGLGRDPLTGLYDRSVLTAHLEQAVAAAARGRAAALLYIDIDGLKQVNDTGGHQEGDRYLVAFADALRAAVRAEDVVARLGGDEFGVLIRNVTTDEAAVVAAAVHARLSAPASVGVAIIDGTVSATDVLGTADRALYAAKAKGGNRVAT